jgi:subtilisin family serine protease
VAVIDDAFLLSHNTIKPFLHRFKNEIPHNFIDDDNNGYVDDKFGWDIADNDVNIRNGKEAFFYHGTWVTSMITRIANLHYGKEAKNLIHIMPIKVLEDNATQGSIRKGHLGIKYAIDNGADIISLSWSGGNPSEEEKNIIAEACAKGIIIVASTGNFNERSILFPANFKKVMAVFWHRCYLRKI